MRNDKTMIYISEFESLGNKLTNFWCDTLQPGTVPKTLIFADYAWATIKEFRSLRRFLEMEVLAEEMREIHNDIQSKRENHTREEIDKLDAKFLDKEKEMLRIFKRVMKRMPEMLFGSYSELIEKTSEPSGWIVLAIQRKWKNEGLISKLKDAERRENREELIDINSQIYASTKEFMSEIKGEKI